MADLGDYISRLVCDASKYVSGTGTAVTANKELTGSCQSLIGQLNRQEKALQTAGRSTLDWINADQKASEEVKEHTRALLERVNALKKLASAANDPILKMMNRTPQTNDPFQAGLRQMGVDQSRDAAAAARDANDPFLTGMARWQKEENAWSRGMSQMKANHAKEMAERDRQAADRKAHAERNAKDPFITGMERYRKENDPFQVGLDRMASDKSQEEKDREYRLAAARSRDVFEREDLANKEQQDRIRARNRAARDARIADNDADQRWGSNRKNSRQNFSVIEAGRFVEDFTQGSIYGGFKGGVMAGSNNLSQLFMGLQSQMQGSTSAMGQAMANYGGIIGSAISTTLILGTVAVDAWMKSASGAKNAEEAVKSYDSSLSKAISRYEELRGIRHIGERPEEMSNASLIAKRRELADLEDSMKEAAKERHIRDKQLGIEGITSDEMRSSLFKQRELIGLSGVPNAKLPVFTQDEARFHNLPAELKTNEAIKAREEREGEVAHQLEKQQELKKSLLAMELEIGRVQRNADVDAEREIEQGFERFQAHQRGGRGPRTDWEMIEERRARNNAQNQREADKFGRGQSWMQSRSEDLLLAGMRDPKDQAAYRAEKEHQESLRRSAEAERLGIMTPDERARMDKASMEKRDRDMREAKYGNLQADGASGFGSADVKSTQGFNAVIKAMRYAEQDKTIQKLKENGDIAAEQLASQLRVEEILKTAPLTVVDF